MKSLIHAFKLGYKLDKGEINFGKPKELHGLYIYTCNDFVNIYVGTKLPGAIVTKVQTLFFNVIEAVIVNDKFWELDDDTQKAVLAHEEGHIKLGHLNKNIGFETIKRMFKETKIEFEADEYAARKLGKEPIIKMLETMKSLGVKRLGKRISAIKSM